MRISVIIPVKQDPVGLSLSLASIPAEENIEINVIDAGGCIATSNVVERAGTRINYYESGQDEGIADAMNRGVAQATGNYIAILNAGDVWFEHTVDELRMAAQSYPEAEVFHGIIEFEANGGSRYQVRPKIKKMAQRMWIFHPTMFVTKSCYERIGGYDTQYKLAMDSEWCHRALAQQVCFRALDVPLARMALGGRSDVGFVDALKEYRHSVVTHQLASRVQAGFWYWFVRTGKTLTQYINRVRFS